MSRLLCQLSYAAVMLREPLVREHLNYYQVMWRLVNPRVRDLLLGIMEEKGNLDRLASGLSLEERRDLLEKLTAGSELTREPLYGDASEGPALKTVEQYAALPWFSRLWLLIRSIFSAKSPLKLFEDRQVAALGREIALHWPRLYDYQQGMLLPAFYDDITELKNGARFFYTALDASVSQDKGAFYGFLGSLELPEIHSRLQTETDPEAIVQKMPKISDPELRQEALRVMDEILSDISTGDRQTMYANVRSLQYLKELSSFLFDRVIMAFSFDKALAGQTCAARLVKDMLNSLNNILYSLRFPPTIPLLESLFIFILQERENAPDFDLQKEIEGLLALSEASLLCIKEFNQRVPLTRILRCVDRNMSLAPKALTGGEDWFALYHDYWKRYTEERLGRFLGGRRKRELLKIFGDFFRDEPLEPLVNAAADENPGGFPLKGSFALSFLLTFHKLTFLGDLNRILKLIFTNGEFVKKENRIEFDECYDFLLGMSEKIVKFDTDISADGDFGRRYLQIRGDMSSLQAKRRKLQLVQDEAAEGADKIIGSARTVFLEMANIFNGIMAATTEIKNTDKYGALSNLEKLEDQGAIGTTDLIGAAQKFQRAQKILDSICAMEAGR
ncbi:hypothetical protein AGMMS49928_28420 [Spirochaetia bacterium]|nr:hypothetical protein AGMMS49928_28420 [Spirochaetia bacterium]